MAKKKTSGKNIFEAAFDFGGSLPDIGESFFERALDTFAPKDRERVVDEYLKKHKGKRKNFSIKTYKIVLLDKQKGKCKKCHHGLGAAEAQAHHKDGDRSNNKLENCVILCANCHKKVDY